MDVVAINGDDASNCDDDTKADTPWPWILAFIKIDANSSIIGIIVTSRSVINIIVDSLYCTISK